MQSDEDIGRMVASVPVAIGSAMEVFAEKLLLSAAECVQRSSTKTLSPMHMWYIKYFKIRKSVTTFKSSFTIFVKFDFFLQKNGGRAHSAFHLSGANAQRGPNTNTPEVFVFSTWTVILLDAQWRLKPLFRFDLPLFPFTYFNKALPDSNFFLNKKLYKFFSNF